ncbi:hypothetical protein J6590_094971 [Homalodisca vitripennis]|nr:hypothetical protein J6590_094971 [Homalodisca vitripennis]
MAGASEPEPPPLPSPSPPPLGLRLAEPPPLATSRTASLVGLRRMMFENISHTDDEKLPGRGKSDVVVEPNKLNFSAKRPVEFNRNSSHRLSDSKIMKGDSGTVASNREIVKSDSVSHKTEIGSDFQCDSDPVSHTSSDSSRPKLVISHHTPEEDGIVVTTEVDEKDGFSSLNVTTDLRIVEAENADVVSVQKLDVDSDLEPNSCSSDLSVVQAKNEVINNSDDEIEYNKLVESKESIENNTVETRSDTIPEETEKVEVKSVNNETEGLLSHAESGSLKDAPDEITENVDEFTSLTHNIEQLVIEAKNEDVINSSDEKGETVIAKDESVSEMLESEEKRDVSEPKVPTPSERVVKHKPPTPQARKVSRALVMPKEEKKKPLEDYPEELNPFGDDDDNELKEKPASTNPFGSSDEEEEEDSSLRKEENVPKPAARKVVPAPKINLNPFWSGDEEEEEENTTPIPKPR